jgi:predicted nuclease with RNAse H fold
MSPLYGGIDLGAESVYCVTIDEHGDLVSAKAGPADDLAWLADWASDISIACVDAPSALSSAPHSDDDGLPRKFRRARCAEIALGREVGCWVPFATPQAGESIASWMETGLKVHARLAELGVRVEETYPHACFRELALHARLPKKTTTAGRERRAALLRQASRGVMGLEMWTHDGLDAFVAALTARDCGVGTGRAIGCGHDGSLIWLPAVPSHVAVTRSKPG